VKNSKSNIQSDDEDDPHDVALLHGSPSKKDFLDKIKQLKQRDEKEEEEEENEITISTDHDLQTYTSTPIVKEKPKPIEELKSIVSQWFLW
jgi:hypothetical protein